MSKLVDVLMAAGGIAALAAGVQRFRESPPKPTEQDQFTRIDYLSGQYEDALEERDRQIRTNRKYGSLFVGLGVALALGGSYLLSREIRLEGRRPIESNGGGQTRAEDAEERPTKRR